MLKFNKVKTFKKNNDDKYLKIKTLFCNYLKICENQLNINIF